MIAQRLGRLPEDTRGLLALAAIQGDGFDPGVLAEAAARPYLEVLRGLESAVAARLITDSHRFVHALVRHTVIDALGTADRMELHRATGTALAASVGEDWREHSADLARYALAAIPPVGADLGEVARTLDYVEAAAERASAALANEEAAALLGRALPLTRGLGDLLRRARLLTALGEAQHHAGDAAHRETLREAAAAALALGDGTLAARARPGQSTAGHRVGQGRRPADRAVRERARDAGAGPELGPCEGSRGAWCRPPPHDRPTPARPGDRGADRRTGRRRSVLLGPRVPAVAGYALWLPDTLAERLAIAEELNALAEPLGDPVVLIDAGVALWYAAAENGDLVRARAALARATAVADELGQPALRLRTLLAQQNCAMLDGRLAD